MSENVFEEVLAGAKAGEPEAVTRLYRLVYPSLLGYLKGVEPGEAEDLASEVWLGIASGLIRFTGDERAFRGWAFTIARRRVLDLRRQRASRRTRPAPPEELHSRGPSGDVEDEAMARLGAEDAMGLLARLPNGQREVLLLRVMGGFTLREVASILGKRQGAVRVLQHRALRRLALELAREEVTK
jgi:RNA polymerase sigma factor (sigma-70 family)